MKINIRCAIIKALEIITVILANAVVIFLALNQ